MCTVQVFLFFFFFHSSPDLDRVKPFDADHSRVSPGNYFSPSILHLPLVLCGAPRSPALRCDFCLSRLSVWPRFSKFCGVKVTVCKCLNGSLIKTEGGISITKQEREEKKTSQQSRLRARPNTSAGSLDLHPTLRSPYFSSHLTNPYCRLRSAYF